MTLHILDHVVFVLIALISPVVDFFAMRKSAALINGGRTELRMKLYRKIIRWEWGSTFVLIALWFLLGRTAADLGLIPQGGAWIGYGLTALICGLLIVQARMMTRTDKGRATLRKQFGWLSFLIPRTRQERRTFGFTSVTAGVCEEVVFRGFLIAYFAALFGVPLWGAALISSIAFGMAHMYQGPVGMLRTGAVGLVFAVLYLMTGSLWAPILAHAVMDLASGHMGFLAFSDPTPPNNPLPELAT